MAGEFTEFDRAAMTRALELAALGMETTQPNPRVGCVIARRDKIIGEGWHEKAGEPHAEVLALRAAGSKAAEATAYVTLEPCSHQGRTPPCVNALIEARVGRVVFAVEDPNPRVSGQGAKALRDAGIDVRTGLMQQEATELNVGFFSRMQHGRPWVRLKSAMSLDGRTALSNGFSRWITGEAARNDVQRWRARSSAVLVGVGTMLADNPRLSIRAREAGQAQSDLPQPLRVVLDSRLRTPAASRFFDIAGEMLVFTTAEFTSADATVRAAALEQRGARIEVMSSALSEGYSPSFRVDLHGVLARLAELEVNELLVEAGPTLTGEFLRQGLVDEFLIYMAPKLLGHQAKPLVELPQLADITAAHRFEILETALLREDLRLRLRPMRKP